MGLEKFTSDNSVDEDEVVEMSSIDSSNEVSNRQSEIHNIQSSTDRDIDKYKDAAVEMLKERGSWPSKSYWNDHKDEYGITTWGGDLEEQIGVSFNNLLLLAGATPLDIHWQDLDESYIDTSILLGASIYGDNLTSMDMQNTNGLVHTDLVKRVTGDTFSERKQKLDLSVQKGKWSKEEVKEIIDEEFNEYETKTSRKIDNRCPFTQSVIKRFGDGSFVDGMESLGYKMTRKQKSTSQGHKSRTSAPSKVNHILENTDSYEEDADGYVYLLKMSKNDEVFYYIGETVDMTHRMVRHVRDGGSVNDIVELDGELVNTGDIDFDVNILAIKSVYANDDEDIEKKLMKLEREKYNQACAKGKIPTDNGVIELPHEKLLGGK